MAWDDGQWDFSDMWSWATPNDSAQYAAPNMTVGDDGQTRVGDTYGAPTGIETTVGGGTEATTDNYTSPYDPNYNPWNEPAAGGGGAKKSGGAAWYQSPGVLGGLITAGAGLLGKHADLESQKEATKRQEEAEKFKYMIELAKLKYGQQGGGGGGGSTGASEAAAYANAINALGQGQRGRSDALQGISAGISGAYR